MQGNQSLFEENKNLERKVRCLECQILPQLLGRVASLEERLSRLEQDGSSCSHWGSDSSLVLGSSSGRISVKSGQKARRTGGPPQILDENFLLVTGQRNATPFFVVGHIAIVGGVRHTIVGG